MAPRAASRSVNPPESLAVVGERVAARIDDLLADEQARWSAVDVDLERPLEALRSFIASGGKRLRPAFCYWAFVGAGGDPEDPIVIDAGGAVELLHTFALVHDDVMDGSGQRRGRSSMHAEFIEEHRRRGWRGEARRFGEGAAILVGDLAFVYADRLLRTVPPDALRVFDDLRVELCAGQFLDLAGAVHGELHPDRAARIERYKSGKYTVERPLQLGAALAGRLDALGGPLSGVGLPLGDAFQLRDDILGVFGDAEVTGKPIGDDLREGKLTPLLAAAVSRTDERLSGALARVGDRRLSDADVRELQVVLVESGAVAEIEARIAGKVDQALEAIRALPMTEAAKAALEDLAIYVAWRET